jgi:hypothetical protein
VTEPPRVAFVVSTKGASAETVTFCAAAPTRIRMFTTASWAIARVNQERVSVSNSSCFTCSSYVPIGSALNRQDPSLPVFTVRVSPVSMFLALTFAPTTTAPCGSVTVPSRVEVGNCAIAGKAKKRSQTSTRGFVAIFL